MTKINLPFAKRGDNFRTLPADEAAPVIRDWLRQLAKAEPKLPYREPR
jgi:hypothetical protein